MEQLERDVYDNYPALVRALIRHSNAYLNVPFEHMLNAIDKMEFTGAFIGPRGTESIDRDMLADHRALITAAVQYRDVYRELVLRAAERDGDD